MKFNQAIEKFVEWGTEDYQNRTLELYVDHLRRFSKYIKNKNVEKLSLYDDVIAYRRNLKARGITDSTINLSMTAIRQLWKLLAGLEHELNIKLPFLWHIIPIKRGILPKSHPAISAENFFKLLKATKGSTPFIQIRDVAILSLFYDTGMRVSEVTALNTTSLDMKDGDWSLRTITRKRRDHAKYRELTWTRETQKLLLAYLDIRQNFTAHDALFINARDGGRLTPRSIERIFKKYAIKAHIDPTIIKPHGCRHGWGERAAESEMYVRYIQEWLGHSSLSGTQIYTKVKNTALKRVFHEKMGDKRPIKSPWV